MGTVHAKDAATGPSDTAQRKLAQIPAHVHHVHIEGLDRTKDDLVLNKLRDVFKAENFADLALRAQIGRLRLQKLGIFKKVDVVIDTSSDKNPNGYDVTYTCQEQGRFSGGINFLVGTNEGNGVFQFKLPNTFGRGETVSANVTRGTKQPLGGGVSFTKPINGNPDVTVGASLSQMEYPHQQSSYTDLRRALALQLKFPTFLGKHVVKWEGAWRQLAALEKAPFEIREHAGHSLKSSLAFSVERDNRNDPILPSNGYLAKYDLEIAGLGGDSNFHKHNLEFQFAKSFVLDTVLQASLTTGYLGPLCPCHGIRIQDKFFLGGPLTLRGFCIDGVGPHSEGSALGADTYFLSGLHLYTPLPFRPGKGGFGDLFRLHGFLNAGSLFNSSDFPVTDLVGAHREDALRRLASMVRASVGCGVVLKMGGVARLELNYCVPLNANQGDRINPGIQFGIGLTFV